MLRVHLVPAHELGSGYSTLIAVCGEEVTGGAGGEDDPRYCLGCVTEAARWNTEATDHELRPVALR